MAVGESKRLLEWLADVDEDTEVLELFRQGHLDRAVDRAAEKHPGGNDHKPLMKENDLDKICRKLKDEALELQSGAADASATPKYWVLVRV